MKKNKKMRKNRQTNKHWLLVFNSCHQWLSEVGTRSINLPSMASMEGGTLLFEGAHLIDAIHAFVAKQANVVITPFFFGKHLWI